MIAVLDRLRPRRWSATSIGWRPNSVPSQNADKQGRIRSLRRGAAKKRLCDFVDPQPSFYPPGISIPRYLSAR